MLFVCSPGPTRKIIACYSCAAYLGRGRRSLLSPLLRCALLAAVLDCLTLAETCGRCGVATVNFGSVLQLIRPLPPCFHGHLTTMQLSLSSTELTLSQPKRCCCSFGFLIVSSL